MLTNPISRKERLMDNLATIRKFEHNGHCYEIKRRRDNSHGEWHLRIFKDGKPLSTTNDLTADSFLADENVNGDLDELSEMLADILQNEVTKRPLK